MGELFRYSSRPLILAILRG